MRSLRPQGPSPTPGVVHCDVNHCGGFFIRLRRRDRSLGTQCTRCTRCTHCTRRILCTLLAFLNFLNVLHVRYFLNFRCVRSFSSVHLRNLGGMGKTVVPST